MRYLSLVLVMACGNSGPSIPLDQLGNELATSSCAKQFECCDDVEIMEDYENVTIEGQPITTEAQCVAFVSALFGGFAVEGYKTSLAAGRIEYNGSAARGCINAVETVTCAEYAVKNNDDVSCEPFIVPLVPDGGACTQDYECTTDNCVGATVQPGGPNTDGACMPLPTVGQDCTSECADGLYCGYDTTAMKELCSDKKADGMTCSFDSECLSDLCDDANMCGGPPPRCDGR